MGAGECCMRAPRMVGCMCAACGMHGRCMDACMRMRKRRTRVCVRQLPRLCLCSCPLSLLQVLLKGRRLAGGGVKLRDGRRGMTVC